MISYIIYYNIIVLLQSIKQQTYHMQSQTPTNANSSTNPASTAQVYSREQYATKQFWDNRYKEKPSSYFDWYAQFPELKETFQQQYNLTPSDRILMLGCGNSRLSQQMYEAGYENIVNIDISGEVINQMKQICDKKGYTNMEWIAMDATDMQQFEKGSFDVIIDKGTLDALISGKNMEICEKMLRESMRVLKREGQFILITYGSPQGRKKFFENSIGLLKYDYYFTRVDLSSMSTLINLMRSNLGNKPLNSIIKDTEAMKKSLMEYNLLKVLRRNKKNQKKYVIWSDLTAKQTQTKQEDNQPPKVQQIQKSTKNSLQQQIKNQEQPQIQKKNETAENQKINYNPKKQSFCYVYSIKQKFAIQMENVITHKLQQQKQRHYQAEIDEHNNVKVPGDSSLQQVAIHAQNCDAQLDKSITYLQTVGIANNPITICPSPEELLKSKQLIKFILVPADYNVIPAYHKSIFEVKIHQNSGKLIKLEQKLQQICQILIEDGGLQAHPSPRQYAYLGFLLLKTDPQAKFHDSLKRYWYPTYRLKSYSNHLAHYTIAVPPTLSSDFCSSTITKILTHLRQCKLQQSVHQTHKGYMNCLDPRLLNLISFSAVAYDRSTEKGKQQPGNCSLIVREFPSQLDPPFTELKLEGGLSQLPVVYFKRQPMPFMLARLFSAV